MTCPRAKNRSVLWGLATVLLLASAMAKAEITHTQLESYDFTTGKHTLYNALNKQKEPGVIDFSMSSVNRPGEAMRNEYRLCLNKAQTKGYLRILSEPDEQQTGSPKVPLVNFSLEQDLHLIFIPLRGERHLVYFTDTSDLWVVDVGATLESSPDCKR
ncbi:hypothetical protein M1D83_06820 [Enterobacteriaceae bacterium]